MDPNTKTELGTPFREQVDIGTFEQIEQAQKEIQTLKELFANPNEKPLVANLGMDFLIKPETPNEVKMAAFKTVADLMTVPWEYQQNIEVAKTLIDMIRSQQDPGIRVRLAALVSHDLQEEYFNKSISQGDVSAVKARQFAARETAFQALLFDPQAEQVYKNWAKFVLHPRGILHIFNELYDRESDLKITPKIIEEITDETEVNEINENRGQTSEPAESFFTGNLIKLNPMRLPTPDKIALYQQKTGRPLPLFIVRKEGGRFISIPFPADLSSQAVQLVQRFRNGQISRNQVFEEAKQIEGQFLEKMNPDQRRELLDINNNLELRFSTEKSSTQQPEAQPLSRAA